MENFSAQQERLEKLLEGYTVSKYGRINMCVQVYDCIAMAGEDAPRLLQYFLEEYSITEFKEGKEPSPNATICGGKAEALLEGFQNLVKELVATTAKKNLVSNEFYQLLWTSLRDLSVLNSREEKGCALYCMWNSPQIPYFQLDAGLPMEDELFRRINKSIRKKVQKMNYIMSQSFSQRTEQASLIVDIIENELSSRETKAVFIAQLIAEVKIKTTSELLDALTEQMNTKKGK